MAQRRVAILGGGLGGLSAAWQLTRTPALRERHAVTVYQMGWRLGGKGASGRGLHGRVEEHGLHLFFGFYDNTFAMVRSLYDELEGDGCLPGWEAAFAPQDELTLYYGAQRNRPWRIRFPRNPGTPGDGGDYPDLREGLRRALAFGIQQLAAMGGLPTGRTGTARALAGVASRLGTRLLRGVDAVGQTEGRAAFLATLASLRRLLGSALGGAVAETDVRLRTWVLVDWALTLVQGIVADQLLQPGAWHAIDDVDYRVWLTRHGASPVTVDSMLVRSYYAAVLASSAERAVPVGAGTALHTQLRMFLTYRGAFLWKMTLGMGETVFTPLHRVLKQRGVKFAFFHQLTDVVPDGSAVSTLRFDVQARVTDGPLAYRPTTRIREIDAWPAAPLSTQLDTPPDGDLDSYTHAGPPVGQRILTRGADFDDVVFAIPVGAIPHSAGSLMAASPRWRLAAQRVKTIQTQSLQLWLRRSLSDLGWKRPPPFATCYAPPVDTWASMEQTLPHEDWPADNAPRGLLYFTGMLDGPEHAPVGDADFAGQQKAIVEENLRRYVRDHLEDAVPGLSAADLFGQGGVAGQLAKANVEPWDRYVLSAPDTNRFRIHPDDTGFDNLTVAGDWTDNGFYSACAEGTVMSGMRAARALTGEAVAIAGEGLW